MAEPWSHDFDALAADSRAGLRSLDATRAVLSRPKEIKMRYFKNHPALAALVVFLALGLVSGAAYAVVHEVWITIDSHESAPQIAHDIRAQLAAQGVTAQVTAEKAGDNKLKVKIAQTASADGDAPDLHLKVNGAPADMKQRGVRVLARCHLDDAQLQRLTAIASGPEVQAILAQDGSDHDRAAAIAKVFVSHGFGNVEVQVADEGLEVTITAPPTT